jgi:hypothetical protein
VDLAARDPDRLERRLDAPHHRDGSAQEHVAVSNVGHEPGDRRGVERVRRPIATMPDEVVDSSPARPGEGFQLSGGRSGQISSYAAPILASEALQAQSASIDIVTGATYTSQAYANSLQSALDQAAADGAAISG